MQTLTARQFDALTWLHHQIVSRGPIEVQIGNDVVTISVLPAPQVGQPVMHKGLVWKVDTIYPHPTEPGRFDCDIVRGCCVTAIEM